LYLTVLANKATDYVCISTNEIDPKQIPINILLIFLNAYDNLITNNLQLN